MNFWISFIVYFQLVTALVGIINWNKFKKIPVLQYYIFIVLYMSLNDFFAQYYVRFFEAESNRIVYNIFYIIHFSYLYILYYTIFKSNTIKKIIAIELTFFFSLVVYEIFFKKIDIFTAGFSLPYIIGGIGMLLNTLYYLYEVLNDDVVTHVNKKLMFWVSISNFFYFLVFLPTKIGFANFTTDVDVNVIIRIRIFMAFLTNSMLIVGFIWSQRD